MTSEEKYQEALAEEALLSTLEESELCPGCEKKNQERVDPMPFVSHEH